MVDGVSQVLVFGAQKYAVRAQIDPQAELTVGIVFLEAHQTNQLHIHPNSQEVLHAYHARVGESLLGALQTNPDLFWTLPENAGPTEAELLFIDKDWQAISWLLAA